MSQKKVNQKTAVKKRKKKKAVGPQIIGIILCVIAISIFINIARDVVSTITLKKQASEISEKLEELQKENAELVATKEKLEDPNYVTTYARGEYMFSVGDEKLFRLPSKGE